MTASALQPEAKTLQPRHRSVMRPVVDPARTMARIRARIAETAPEDARLRVLLVLAHEVLRVATGERCRAGSTRTPRSGSLDAADTGRLEAGVLRARSANPRAGRRPCVPSGVECPRHQPRRRCAARPAGLQGARTSRRDSAAPTPASTRRQRVGDRSPRGVRAEGAEFLVFPGTASGGSTTTASSRIT